VLHRPIETTGIMGKWLSLTYTMGRKKPYFCVSFAESQQ